MVIVPCQCASADTLYATQLTQDGHRTAVINRFGKEGESLGQLANLDVPVFDLAYGRERDQLYSLSGATRFFDVDIRDGSLTNIVSAGEIGIQTSRVYGMALDADGLPVVHILAGSYGGDYPAIVSFSKRTGQLLFGTEVGGGQIAIDRRGDFYITVPGMGEVKRFNPSGEPLGRWVSGLASPADLIFDQQGDLYVSELGTGAIKRFDSTGTLLDTFASDGHPRALGMSVRR